jgi:hypothetical protein
VLFLNVTDKLTSHIKQQARSQFCILNVYLYGQAHEW